MRFFMAVAAMLCWVGVNAQTITINYEQEGNGSPQVEYLNSSFRAYIRRPQGR